MAAKRKRYDCNGCRRAAPGCSQICESVTNQESEENSMKRLRVIPMESKEVKNIVYFPSAPRNFWQRLAGKLANFFAAL